MIYPVPLNSQALRAYPPSIFSWKKAIALCVPSSGATLTRAEQQLKQVCEDGHKAAQDAQAEKERQVRSIIDERPDSRPWNRALEMEKDIESIGMSSVSCFPLLTPHWPS